MSSAVVVVVVVVGGGGGGFETFVTFATTVTFGAGASQQESQAGHGVVGGSGGGAGVVSKGRVALDTLATGGRTGPATQACDSSLQLSPASQPPQSCVIFPQPLGTMPHMFASQGKGTQTQTFSWQVSSGSQVPHARTPPQPSSCWPQLKSASQTVLQAVDSGMGGRPRRNSSSQA